MNPDVFEVEVQKLEADRFQLALGLVVIVPQSQQSLDSM
jgi:hypothetical protein